MHRTSRSEMSMQVKQHTCNKQSAHCSSTAQVIVHKAQLCHMYTVSRKYSQKTTTYREENNTYSMQTIVQHRLVKPHGTRQKFFDNRGHPPTHAPVYGSRQSFWTIKLLRQSIIRRPSLLKSDLKIDLCCTL